MVHFSGAKWSIFPELNGPFSGAKWSIFPVAKMVHFSGSHPAGRPAGQPDGQPAGDRFTGQALGLIKNSGRRGSRRQALGLMKKSGRRRSLKTSTRSDEGIREAVISEDKH